MKKLVRYILILLVVSIVVIIVISYPISSAPKNLPALADTATIRHDLEAIMHTSRYRNFKNTNVLDSVAEYITQQFLGSTDHVIAQPFTVNNKNYKNIIASYGPENAERIVIGAHYDVCEDQDGADDNASGTAGLLGLSRLLRHVQLKYRIDLVAYSLEEPPFFGTAHMGSYVHAKSLYDANVPVKGMISLEMIGYYADQENTQNYPAGFLKYFYGSKGNYITIVQRPFNGSFPRQFKRLAFVQNSILTKSFTAPSFVGGTDLSDHRNYWTFGYSALMITNTAFYRNTNYHTDGDVLATLNIPNIGRVIDGVFRVVKAID